MFVLKHIFIVELFFVLQKTFVLDDNVHLNGYTILFPSVCVGNAAQLTVDLIIATLEMQKVATIWHVSLINSFYQIVFIHITMD